ncbi:class I SAM-dependent methyltransferase [Luteimonas weifangensis]|uniref:Class I SAM-dependent methyltransferase n=2 Tax=Cognatiluteimonas weifangensis TaxID=2303539 RepID=A0A372DNA8_9GAMM|nr:class I SAM-dependent methyltransferase [Luteimonas weifangensis]
MAAASAWGDAVPPSAALAPTGAAVPAGVSAVGLLDARLSGWYREDTGELFRGVPIGADDVVVDVGCGAGVNSVFCVRHGARVIALDRQPRLLREVRRGLAAADARAATALAACAERLPLRDGVATRLVCTELLQHVDDPRQLLAELYRVGGVGALYLLSVPDARQEALQQQALPPDYLEQPGARRVIGRDAFAQLVTDAGLTVLEHTQYGFFWSIWWALFPACGVELDDPAHPVLDHWVATWHALLQTPQGRQLQQRLDRFLPLSQVIVARKSGVRAQDRHADPEDTTDAAA